MPTRLGLALLLSIAACNVRQPVRYELPEGFRGWAEVKYEDPNCPPLPLESGQFVVRLSGDGRACTSSAFQEGWAHDQYFVTGQSKAELKITASGQGGTIWGSELIEERPPSGRPSRRERFFVGAEKEYQSAVNATIPKSASP